MIYNWSNIPDKKRNVFNIVNLQVSNYEIGYGPRQQIIGNIQNYASK